MPRVGFRAHAPARSDPTHFATLMLVNLSQLLEKAEGRWASLASTRPDLAAAIDLQRRLVARSLELGATIDEHPPLQLALAPAETVSRLNAKRPVLADSTVELDPTPFESFVLAFCDDFAQGGAGRLAARLRGTLERGEIDLGSLLVASLLRRQHAIRTKAHHVGVAADLLWLVAELAVAPLAHRLQFRCLTEAATGHPALRAALDAWDEGCCPACGSWPALSEVVDDVRSLRCSFCGGAWRPPTRRCIYCDEEGTSFLAASLTEAQQAERRLELCRTCGGYLKSLTMATPTPFELLPVEDLASSDLDAGAVERGYARPPMREFDTYNRNACD